MDQAAPPGEGNAVSIKGEVAEADVVGTLGCQQRSAAGEPQCGRAAHADELRAFGKLQRSGAVDAGGQRERRVGAGRLIDRPLQRAGLVAGCVGPYAIMSGVAPERRCQRCRTD